MMNVSEAISGAVDSAVKNLIRDKRFPVIAGGALRLMQTGMEPWAAWVLARKCIARFCADEGVRVGDKRYAWDGHGGADIVEEYELRHWDAEKAA